MRKCLSYDDVLLVPQYSDIKSRSEVNIESRLGNTSFPLPIISSPMDTVTETEMALAMDTAGGLGIVHRYCSIIEQIGFVRTPDAFSSCSVLPTQAISGDV